jgi:hypothetical protein
MGRPSILLTAHEGLPSLALEGILDCIARTRTHRLEEPPLLYSCLEVIDEKLEARTCGTLFETMAIVLLPRQQQWLEIGDGISLTINDATCRSPLLELVCRYPEVYWVFVRHPDDGEESEGYKALQAIPQVRWEDHLVGSDRSGLNQLASLIRRHSNGFRTLLDPTGLRAGARGRLRNVDNREDQPPSIFALSVEDESSFALFNGYALFRRGFSTYLAASLKETERLLSDPSIKFSAVIEDLFLTFRDEERTKLIKKSMVPADNEMPDDLLKRRMLAFGKLEKQSATFYHLVISSASPRDPISSVAWTTKPYGGMLAKEIEKAARTLETLCFRRGQLSVHGNPKTHQRHGISGVLHVVAEDLVRRAGEALTDRAINASATAAVHAAVLALEALRILGPSNSSVALTALALQHKAEVIADCMFIGTMTGLNAQERLRDLRESVDHLLGAEGAQSNGGAKSEIQRLDAMMHIAMELSSIYDSCGRFDEAEVLRRSVLRYQLGIQAARSAFLYAVISTIRWEWRNVLEAERSDDRGPIGRWREEEPQSSGMALGLLAAPAIVCKSYIGMLLRSGWIIAGACIVWICLFGIVYMLGTPKVTPSHSVSDEFLNSGSFFVSGNALPGPMPTRPLTLFLHGAAGRTIYCFVVFLNCLVGFIHLGVFIAYLYSKVARK